MNTMKEKIMNFFNENGVIADYDRSDEIVSAYEL